MVPVTPVPSADGYPHRPAELFRRSLFIGVARPENAVGDTQQISSQIIKLW
jgi:hypothetical protein